MRKTDKKYFEKMVEDKDLVKESFNTDDGIRRAAMFNSKLKKDLFNLSDALETASKEAGSPIVAQVKGAFIYIKDRMIYIYTESGSGYGFGIDLVRSFDDFTKGFNKYKRRAIEKSLNDILESNKYYPTKDPKHELDSWIKSIF